jgi:hypothetical protein
MAWTTKKTINLRATVAFATDNAGEICLSSDPTQASDNPIYASGTNGHTLTLDGDTFNAGWLNTGTNDGSRDRSANRPSSSDHRLAGRQGFTTGTGSTFRLQAGIAAGIYRIWVAITDQTNGTGGAPTWTLSDANGTIITSTGTAALAANAVYDINSTLYASSTAWAAAADGGGVGFTFTTTDTSNGNGGPLLTLVGNVGNCPVSCVSIQYLGAAPGGPVDLVGPQTPTSGGSGNSSGGSSTGWWATTGFNAVLSGVATKLNAYVNSIGVATTLYLAIYDSGGFLMASGSTPIAGGLNTVTIPSVAIFQGLKYYLFWQADSSATLADDGGSFQSHFISNTAGTFPLTIPIGGGSVGGTGIPTIYATGVANGVVLLAGSIFPTNAQGLGGGGASGNMFWRTNGFVATAAGNATSLNVYIKTVGTATTLRMGLYDNGGNLLQQGSVAITSGYNTIPITATAITLGQAYTIVWQADASISPADDGTASFKVLQLAHTFGALPSTITFGSGSGIAEGVPSTWIMGPGNIPFTPFVSTQFFVQDRTVQF